MNGELFWRSGRVPWIATFDRGFDQIAGVRRLEFNQT
jgi:hypothetical protein